MLLENESEFTNLVRLHCCIIAPFFKFKDTRLLITIDAIVYN